VPDTSRRHRSERGEGRSRARQGSRGAPKSITVDNGTEFASKAMDLWAYSNSVHLDFIRSGKTSRDGYIESFNGRLRDECLNVEVFFSLADARGKLELWRHEYNVVSYCPTSLCI
jgi:putative transposase